MQITLLLFNIIISKKETGSYIEKPVFESNTKNVYYNETKEENETGGYYAFSVGSQIPKEAIEVKTFYDYVEKRRGKEGDIEKEFLVSIFKSKYTLNYPKYITIDRTLSL